MTTQCPPEKFYFLSEANTLLDGLLADFLIWCRQQGVRIYRIKPKDSEITRPIVESSAILRFAHESHVFLRYARLPETGQKKIGVRTLGEPLLPQAPRNESEIPIAPDPQWYESLSKMCKQHKLSCSAGLKVAHYKPLTRIRDRNQIIINGHPVMLKRSLTGVLFDSLPFRKIPLDRDVPENGFLLIRMEDLQVCFIIPSYLVAGQKGIMLPTLGGIQSRWQPFRNAWELLEQPPEVLK